MAKTVILTLTVDADTEDAAWNIANDILEAADDDRVLHQHIEVEDGPDNE